MSTFLSKSKRIIVDLIDGYICVVSKPYEDESIKGDIVDNEVITEMLKLIENYIPKTYYYMGYIVSLLHLMRQVYSYQMIRR